MSTKLKPEEVAQDEPAPFAVIPADEEKAARGHLAVESPLMTALIAGQTIFVAEPDPVATDPMVQSQVRGSLHTRKLHLYLRKDERDGKPGTYLWAEPWTAANGG